MMKKIIVAATLALFTITTISAQKQDAKGSFEGIIKYGISFEGSGLPQEAMAMLSGAEAVTYIKGDQRRMDLNMAIQSTTAITDPKTKSVITLMDVMGQKYLIRITEADLKKEEATAPELTIKYLDETKEIAGYKCKKAEITMKTKEGKTDVVYVYYTDEIPASEVKAPYKGLKGFPMEYQMNQGGLRMTFTTKSVSKEAVAAGKFEIPAGYTEITMEDFQKTMLKMGGQ